jgi:arginine exporter protein ArgO
MALAARRAMRTLSEAANFRDENTKKQESQYMPIFVWIAIAAATLILAGSTGVAVVSSADKIAEPMVKQVGQNFLSPLGWGIAAAVLTVSVAAGLRIFKR